MPYINATARDRKYNRNAEIYRHYDVSSRCKVLRGDADNYYMGCKGSRVQISALRPTKFVCIPVRWVTFYTGDMGNTFAAKGLSALSIRHVSWSTRLNALRFKATRQAFSIRLSPIPSSRELFCQRRVVEQRRQRHSADRIADQRGQ